MLLRQFANAGIVDFETLSSTTPAALDRMLDVNVIGAFNSVTWAARGMMNTSEGKPASGGSIIVTVRSTAMEGLTIDLSCWRAWRHWCPRVLDLEACSRGTCARRMCQPRRRWHWDPH